MGTPNISIQVQDGIASSIQPKIEGIAKTARDAGGAFKYLQAAINTINGQGLSGLQNAISKSSTSLTRFNTNIDRLTVGAAKASIVMNDFALSIDKVGISSTTASAALSSLRTSFAGASGQASNFARGAQAATAGMGSVSGGAIVASTELRVLENGFAGNTRGAARFLASIPGLAPLLSAAFPVFGAVALIGVFAMVYEQVGKLILRFTELGTAYEKSHLGELLSGKETIQPKPGFMQLYDKYVGGATDQKPLTLTDPSEAIRRIKQDEENQERQARVAEAGLTGGALQRQRVIDLEKIIELKKQEKVTVDQLKDSYTAQLLASHPASQNSKRFDDLLQNMTPFGALTGQNANAGRSVTNIVDDAQRRKLEQSAVTAQELSRTIDSQIKDKQTDIKVAQQKEPGGDAKDALKAQREELVALREELDGYLISVDTADQKAFTSSFWLTTAAQAKTGSLVQRTAFDDATKALRQYQAEVELDTKQTGQAFNEYAVSEFARAQREERAADARAAREEAQGVRAYYTALRESTLAEASNNALLADSAIRQAASDGAFSRGVAAQKLYQVAVTETAAKIAALKSALASLEQTPGLSSNIKGAAELKTNSQIDTLKAQLQVKQDALDPRATKSIKTASAGDLLGGFGEEMNKTLDPVNNLRDGLTGMFSTLKDGFADTVGRAIFTTHDFGSALKDVAREAVGGLVSSLIKLGTQLIVVAALKKALGGSQDDGFNSFFNDSGSGGSGGSSGGGIGGILTKGLGALAGVFGFAEGGVVSGPGSGTSDSILARVSHGEFVVKAAAVKQHRAMLEAINSGAKQVHTASTQVTNGTQSPQLNVNVQHDGSTAIQVQRVGLNDVHVIAKQHAQDAVAAHTDTVVAGHLSDPNSKSSKAIQRFTDATRKR